MFCKNSFSRLGLFFAPAVALLIVLGSFSAFAGQPDALGVDKLVRPLVENAQCGATPPENGVLTLRQAVDLALCNNSQTRIGWINARAQAAQVGVAKSAYLPSVTVNGSLTQARVSGASSNNQDLNATISYLLYDFGQRSANLESAVQTLNALNATQNSAIQSVFFSVVQAYYQLFAAEALVQSSKDAEKTALESYNAASRKFELGVATPADTLQAKTAHSQAILTRIQAEGSLRNAKGVLANVLGLGPTLKISFEPPSETLPDEKAEQDIGALIEAAVAKRPDMLSAEAQTAAAKAAVESAKASGRAAVSLSGTIDRATSGLTNTTTDTQSASLQLSIPIFSGYGTTYRIRSAEEQTALRLAQEEQIKRQVELDVWQAYQNLVTSAQSVKSAADLVESASESHKAISGRYTAGKGTILEVLTAQSALESARQQQIQALFNWRINKAALAKATGQIEIEPNKPTQEEKGKKEGGK